MIYIDRGQGLWRWPQGLDGPAETWIHGARSWRPLPSGEVTREDLEGIFGPFIALDDSAR